MSSFKFTTQSGIIIIVDISLQSQQPHLITMSPQFSSAETSFIFDWINLEEWNSSDDEFLPLTNSQSEFNKPCLPSNDIGVQTMTTAIPRFPVDCRSHFVPWGLDTYGPSPLTLQKNKVDYSYNDKKRKREDSDSAFPPNKRLASDNEDHVVFDSLISPINNDGYPEECHTVKEEDIVRSSIPCPYEGVVDDGISSIGCRSISTNTNHVPMRRAPPKYYRSEDWSHTAMLFLSEEDRVDKRPSHGSEKDRTKRLENKILDYYCRQRNSD